MKRPGAARCGRGDPGCLRRPDDFGARYGGEEFTVLLPDTNRLEAKAIVETIRAAVSALGLAHVGSPRRLVTVSVGMSSTVPKQGQRSQSLLQTAHAALYRATASGRDALQAV